MGKKIKMFSIGFVAQRTGLSVSAIRYYEEEGLIFPTRNSVGQRRFLPSDIRRLSFIIIAQQLGFSLSAIKFQMGKLPNGRTPTQKDWEKISKHFGQDIDTRIAALQNLRDKLDSCIGCGCLSLKTCALYNKDDNAGKQGAGPRYLMGDAPSQITKSGI